MSLLFAAVPIHMNETDCVPGNPPNVPCPPSWEGVHFGSCCCPALATPGSRQEPHWLPRSAFPGEGEHRLIPAGDGGRVPECSPPTRNASGIWPLLTARATTTVVQLSSFPPGLLQQPHQVAPTKQGHPVEHLSGLVTPWLKTLWSLLSHSRDGEASYLSPQG